MSQTLTDRVKAIKNTPDTGEQVQIAEFNSAFDKLDNHFVPAAKIYNTVAQSYPNAATTMTVFNNTRFDTYAARSEGPMADLSNEQIIIRKTGLYVVSVSANILFNATGYRALSYKRNATFMRRITQDANVANSVDTSMSLTDIALLTAGDLITAHFLQNSGGALSSDPTVGGVQDSQSLSVVWAGSAVEV